MDLYSILEVTPDSSLSDIKKSYYRLAKLYHPDRENGTAEMFQKINYAYTILNNEKTRTQYNIMSNKTKNNFMLFLETFFKNNDINNILSNIFPDIKNFTNIEDYNFNDIITLFNNSIQPLNKSNNSIECSDSDIMDWDETHAEYYESLPLKYYQYNKNNINLELKCNLNDILNTNNVLRSIKINRNFFGEKQINSFQFNYNSPYVVFFQGGDISTESSGHLIIHFSLPKNYIWDKNNIIYKYNINLYEFIYGIDLELNFNNIKYDIKQWIPYRDSLIIPVTNVNRNNFTFEFIVQLNLLYIDTIDKKNILGQYFLN